MSPALSDVLPRGTPAGSQGELLLPCYSRAVRVSNLIGPGLMTSTPMQRCRVELQRVAGSGFATLADSAFDLVFALQQVEVRTTTGGRSDPRVTSRRMRREWRA